MSVDRRALGAIAVTLSLWSSAFAGIRSGLQTFTPGHLALLRFLFASAVLGIFAAFSHMRKPDVRDLPHIAAVGLFGVMLYHTLLNTAETRVSAGSAGVLIASSPVFIALLATIFLRERLNAWGWFGILVSFGGSALVSLGEGKGIHLEPYALLVLAAALSGAVYFVLLKPLLRRYSPLELTSYAVWMGTIMLCVFLPGLPRALTSAPASAILVAAYLGALPGGIAYITWAIALKRTPASVLGTYQYLIPLLAVLIAWVWRHEIPRPLALVGGAISLGGVILVNTLGRAREIPEPGEEIVP